MFWRKALIYKESVLIGLLIAYFSLVKEPVLRLPEEVPFMDKWEHLVAYLCLAGALTLNMWRGKVESKILWLLGAIIPVLYGGLMELIQGACCYPRTASWWDFVADIIGTLIGVSMVAGLWIWKH